VLTCTAILTTTASDRADIGVTLQSERPKLAAIIVGCVGSELLNLKHLCGYQAFADWSVVHIR
jgi:hypothetical protein